MGKKTAAWKDENSELDIDMDYKPYPVPEAAKKASLWLKLGLWGMFILISVLELTGNTAEPSSFTPLQLFFMAAFALMFSSLCERLAGKIGRNADFAWGLGFLFGLFGFGAYGVYYLVVVRREKKEGERQAGDKDSGERTAAEQLKSGKKGGKPISKKKK
jgi:hypothetical protein